MKARFVAGSIGVLIGALGLCAFNEAQAQSVQVKPWFLVILDSSGSMGDNNSGTSTQACRNLPPGGNCTTTDTRPCCFNSCGYYRNRINDAKCVLQKLVDSTGDAQFGLMHFSQTCGSRSGGFNTCSGGGSVECRDLLGAAFVREPIADDNQTSLLRWIDQQCKTTSGTNPNCTPSSTPNSPVTATTPVEIWAAGNTPLAGSLRKARCYLQGYDAAPGDADAECFGAAASPIRSDPYRGCRPVSVILLTDGASYCDNNCAMGQSTTQCAGDPIPRAQALLNNTRIVLPDSSLLTIPVKTYVIGFGLNPNQDREVDAIARAGGTDNPLDANREAFYAQNEAELSLAFSRIIADSVLTEKCGCLGRPDNPTSCDEDCDTAIDEGFVKYCNRPSGVTTQTLCMDPGEQMCDTQDDNCDGRVDEGLLNACGICGAAPEEVCDGTDNDCDFNVDEGLPLGSACGGQDACIPGEFVCLNGEYQCQGLVPKSPEICDCEDDDCDGQTDENPLDCAAEDCVNCSCATPCMGGGEFGQCPPGKVAIQKDGLCLCVQEQCNVSTCSEQTVEMDGNVQCGPDRTDVTSCVCKNNQCTHACQGVVCPEGTACNPRDRRGRCVENNCRGLGCPEGQLCDVLSSVPTCRPDPCATVECPADEACRDGVCEGSCATVECGVGQVCRSGVCEPDPCAEVSCELGQVCEEETGNCVQDKCVDVRCPGGSVCVPSSGTCKVDPCVGLRCPAGQACMEGQCESIIGNTMDAGTARRVLATGGGGCGTCSMREASPTTWTWFAPLAVALALWTRRSRTRKERR